jgi:hypothetical protein
MNETVLVSTWAGGLFVVEGSNVAYEQAGHVVRGLAAGDDGSTLAIVGQSVCRRDRAGSWTTLATGEALACCVMSRGEIFVGDDAGAQLWRVAGGALERIASFDATPGRDKWYAGQALVDGKWMGPPLGIRSIAASCDGVVFANVHVGGIARSSDRGATWHPTIDVDADVHQVVCHPSRPEIVVAAAGAGLCTSRDGGMTWRIETAGLHANYCSAVAIVGDDVYVAASESHFAKQGAIYRRGIDGDEPLAPVDGLPRWTAGIVDTQNIAVAGSRVAVVDYGGHVHVSQDGKWAQVARIPAPPSSVLLVG